MDHRASTRQTLNLGVHVNYHGESYKGSTRDVCLGGLFVDVDNMPFRKGNAVDLTFRLEQASQKRNYALRAKVVRVEQNGIGMCFADSDITAFRALQELMHLTWSEDASSGPIH